MIDHVQLMDEPAASSAIRTLCENTEPDALWEALEANGIETTPGVIYQVLNKPQEHPESHSESHVGHGLSPEDLATLGELAAKVGGIEKLIGILQLCK